MRNLIRAGFIRYMRRIYTWGAFLVSFALGILTMVEAVKYEMHSGEIYYYFAPDLGFFILIMFIAVILTVLNIGSEFGSGAVRNKLIAGYTKIQIYVSELILSLTLAVVAFLLYYLPLLIIRISYLEVLGFLLGASLLLLLCVLSVTAMAVFFCFVIKNHIVDAVIVIMMIVCMTIIRDEVYNKLQRPEFFTLYTYEDGHEVTMYAEPDTMKTPDDVISVRKVKNSFYIGGIKRDILTFIFEADPYTAVVDCGDYIRNGYSRATLTNNLPENIASREAKEREKQLNRMKREIAYNAGILVVFSVLGILIFRKRNIK